LELSLRKASSIFWIIPALGFSFRATDADYDFDTDDDSATDVAGYVVDAAFRTNLSERSGSVYLDHAAVEGRVDHRLRFDRTTQKEDTVAKFGPSSSDLITQVVTYRLQVAADGESTQDSDQLFSLLVERREDENRDGEGTRENNSIALEYRGWLTDNASMQAGLRRDDNSAFINETTWNLSGSYFVGKGTRVHASAGRSVVNPEFFTSSSNPDLIPEKNIGYDIGIETPFPAKSGTLDFTYFNEKLEDKIFFETPTSVTALNAPSNSNRQGIELSVFLKPVELLELTLNYTLTDATNSDGEIEIRRPRNEIGINTTWRLPNGATTLSGDLRYVRGLYDQKFWEDGDPREKLPNFTVVNLLASHSLTDHIDLTARITNAFDEDYQEVWGYATRGRAGYVGVRASW